ncbi:histone lysine demethylase PHF8-like isoform X2 [Brachionus plicatilis]|uniref:Histone lysine demethylase PHF8-like isoform X2 n=1 Tax=Brachionus plicatilis TaxID=10195 RepID=A0A3M7Q0W0_BRAPC|nr:histone lysine demethylase PHF8-like isoform X2 [Brachionus plicatilis]
MSVDALIENKKLLGIESPPDSLLSPPSNPPFADLYHNTQTPPDNAEKSNYCLCDRKSCDEGEIMIQCDFCEQWFHLPCVNLSARLIADIETYVCSACRNEQRQTIYKKRLNYHRHDYSDPNAAKKPVQAGTQLFVDNLLKKNFPSAFENGIVKKIHSGEILTKEYFEKNKFDSPVLIEDKSTLGFTMPSSDEIDLSKIENIVGGDYSIDVIDVERQEVYQMSITELNSYFRTEPREKIYNLISFEISKTKLTENITAPKVVEELSWVSNGVWSGDEQDSLNASKTNHIIKPEVQKYCLISAGRSFTDFHVDFGGSSVWYHVVKGDKIFYLIEPSDENLKLYEQWNTLKNQSEIFFGDRVKNCYQFELKAGNTILLPSGWIHAVYTPSDSLVFGGNFLHSHSITLQLKIYELETRLKTPEKYRFPAFETLQWYAAKFFTQILKEKNSKKECIDSKLQKNLKYLNNTLRKWITSKDYYETHDYEIPKKINCDKLVKIMNKELNKSEFLIKSQSLYKKKMSAEKSQKEVLNYTNITDGIKVDDLTEPAPIKLKIKLKSSQSGEQIGSEDEAGNVIDGDYVYPNIGDASSVQVGGEQKSSRKRKIKPFAAHYLAPKGESPGTNLEDDDNDEDYFNVEEEADDNDEDFKLKVKNNLKLSNKLKKKQLRKEKMASEDKDQSDKKTTGLTPSAIGTKQKNKKGHATTKQRLGKLLKLNRIINI